MRHLTELFAIAARHYAEVAVRFGISDPQQCDFALLVHVTEQAQRESEAAFEALRFHAGAHRCMSKAKSTAAGS